MPKRVKAAAATRIGARVHCGLTNRPAPLKVRRDV